MHVTDPVEFIASAASLHDAEIVSMSVLTVDRTLNLELDNMGAGLFNREKDDPLQGGSLVFEDVTRFACDIQPAAEGVIISRIVVSPATSGRYKCAIDLSAGGGATTRGRSSIAFEFATLTFTQAAPQV